MSINKFLSLLLISLLIISYYIFKPPLTGDAAVCAKLAKDPSTLPFVSYSTPEGFNECVSRCMTSVMSQVCGQLPDKSNLFATRPDIQQKMLVGCNENIQHFVTHNIRCHYLNCEP